MLTAIIILSALLAASIGLNAACIGVLFITWGMYADAFDAAAGREP